MIGHVIQGREVDDSDVFHYNSGFTHQLFRIKINSIQLKETVEENKKTNDQVLQDRQYQARLIAVEMCSAVALAMRRLMPILVWFCF